MPPLKSIGAAEKHPRHGGETWTILWTKSQGVGDVHDVGLDVGDRFRLEERNYKRMRLYPDVGTRLYDADNDNREIRLRRDKNYPEVFKGKVTIKDATNQAEEVDLYWYEGVFEGNPPEESQLYRTHPVTGPQPNGSAGNRR